MWREPNERVLWWIAAPNRFGFLFFLTSLNSVVMNLHCELDWSWNNGLACLWSCDDVFRDEEGTPTLQMVGTIPWKRVLEWIKQEKATVLASLWLWCSVASPVLPPPWSSCCHGLHLNCPNFGRFQRQKQLSSFASDIFVYVGPGFLVCWRGQDSFRKQGLQWAHYFLDLVSSQWAHPVRGLNISSTWKKKVDLITLLTLWP